MGYDCPQRQTTADFLTSLTNRQNVSSGQVMKIRFLGAQKSSMLIGKIHRKRNHC